MKANLKLVIRSASFIVILLALLIGASYIFMPKDNKKESGMDFVDANGILGEKEGSIDVLIVGDSEIYSSFSPMYMWQNHGFTSYVCGTAAQPLYDSLRFIELALQKQSPSAVILETNAIFRKKDAGSFLLSALQSRFSVFRYHDRWKSMRLRDLYTPASYTWTNDFKGYYYSPKVQAAEKKDYMTPTDRVQSIPDLNLLCMQKIHSLCREKGAQLILVSAPSPVNWNYARHNAIKALAGENGIPFLDLNLEPVGIDWNSDTRDKGDHLNHFGATKVSDFIGTYLTASFPLRDRRQDAHYQNWQDAYQRYCKVVLK